MLPRRGLFTDKFHGEGEVIRPDYGCFETWNTTPQKVVNVSDNYYPHAGSVVYVGKESEVRLTDALTKDFAPFPTSRENGRLTISQEAVVSLISGFKSRSMARL